MENKKNSKNIFGEIYDNAPKKRQAIYRKRLQTISISFYKNFLNRIAFCDIHKMKYAIVLSLIDVFLEDLRKETTKKNQEIYQIAKSKRIANKNNTYLYDTNPTF